MILITGATGHLGKATIASLLQRQPGSKIAALVRNPEKATELSEKGLELRQGDYFNYASLVAAMKGIDTLMLISSSDMNERSKQHIQAIDAAKEAGVKHIVYTSMVRPDPKGIFMASPSHYDTEQHLLKSGITYTLLRDTLYFEILPMVLNIEQILSAGAIHYPGGEGRITFGKRAEMGEALAAVLSNLTAHRNQTYDLGINAAYSFGDMAQAISKLSGKTISYIDVPEEAFRQQLEHAQLPAEVVGMATMMAAAFKANEFNAPSDKMEQLLGHKPTDLEGFLKEMFFH